jgi:hypothetical protein
MYVIIMARAWHGMGRHVVVVVVVEERRVANNLSLATIKTHLRACAHKHTHARPMTMMMPDGMTRGQEKNYLPKYQNINLE